MPKLQKTRQTKWQEVLFGLLDIVATVLTFFLSALFTNRFTQETVAFDNEFVFVGLIVVFTWIILLKSTNLARIPRTSVFPVLLSDFVRLSLIGGIILLLLDYVVKLDGFPSITILLFVTANFFTLFIIRLLTFRLFKKFRVFGHNVINVLVFAGEKSSYFVDKLLNHKEWGYNVVYFVTNSEEVELRYRESVNIKSDKTHIQALLKHEIIDEILFFDCFYAEEQLSEMIQYAHKLGINVRIKGDYVLPPGYKRKLQYFNRIPFVTIENNPVNNYYYSFKAIWEFSLAFLLLSLFSPLLLVISVAIAFSSKGPIVYKQERIGLQGRKFYMYKFRTTCFVSQIPKNSTAHVQDKVTTPIGRFIARYKLDFIPQFLNVLKGEMSLVGPMAPTPAQYESFEEWQLKSLSVKPGLTGMRQIALKRTSPKAIGRLSIDIEYIENWSLKADVSLFFRTFFFIFLYSQRHK